MKCGEFVSIMKCSHCGNYFSRPVDCGREWCPECGQDDSRTHLQRIRRSWRAIKVPVLGYWVFTIPDNLRGPFRTKDSWNWCFREVKKILQGIGIIRGVRRFHWYGDKSGYQFNPHINVLCDMSPITENGYIPYAVILAVKARWRIALEKYMGINLYHREIVVDYSYKQKMPKRYHALRYVMRSTAVQGKADEWLKTELYRFNNVRWFGCWEDIPKDDPHPVLCPFCNLPDTLEHIWVCAPVNPVYIHDYGEIFLIGNSKKYDLWCEKSEVY